VIRDQGGEFLLENIGRASTSKRTRHINIRFSLFMRR
jgi:hypothetical protein